MRTASCIDSARTHGDDASERGLHFAGRFADGDDGTEPTGVRTQAAEIEGLVAPAGDEHECSNPASALAVRCGLVAFESS